MMDEWLDASVTALKVVDLDGDVSVLAGIGNRVEGWTEDGIKFRKNLLLGTNAIHGIKEVQCGPFAGNLAVHGGKELCVCKDVEVKGRLFCNDWIVDAFFKRDVLILTSHNKLLRYDKDFELVEEIPCEEKCILYSGIVVDDPHLGVAILSGTVFQEVVVWCPNGDGDRPVLHRLKGHEGVLFAIIYDEKSQLICSTSDDRTARIWEVNAEAENWETATVRLKINLEGQHTSRIFGANFINLESGNYVSTYGEDSTVCVWRIDDGSPVKKFNHDHLGCPVWSGDVSIKSDSVRIFTGGLNAAIRSFQFSPEVDHETVSVPYDADDYPKSLLQLPNSVVCLTNSGNVFAIEEGKMTKILSDETLADYATMNFDDASKSLIFGTLKGDVVLYGTSGDLKFRQTAHRGRKIHTLILIKESKILTLSDGGVMKVADILEDRLMEVATFKLPKCASKKFQKVFCSVMVEDHLLVGERNGSVHLYQVSKEAPIFSLNKIHGPNGCCDVKHFDKVLWTAGRDGTVRKFLIEDDSLQQIAVRRLKSSWLEKIAFTKTGRTLIMGFHSTSLLVFDLEEDLVLWRVECGGCHRSWASKLLLPNPDENMKTYFIKDGQVIGSNPTKTGLLRKPLHSHDISSVHHFKINGRSFLATSGDDTTIKINDFRGIRRTLTTLTGHISTVKAMASYETKDGVKLISVGGRAQMIVWRVILVGDEVFGTVIQNHMLKGDDKLRKKKFRKGKVQNECLVPDPETRYMDVAVKIQDDDSVRVAISCSDGVLRLFSVDDKDVQIVFESTVHSHSLIKVLSDAGSDGFYVSSTDGHLYKVDFTNRFQKVGQFHQSGINALCMEGQDIYTGGDDGAICVKKGGGRIMKYPICHSSTIAGIHRLNEETLLSVSIDQRISVWSFKDDKLELKHQSYCHVPDVQSSAMWNENGHWKIGVVGAGFQVFTLQMSTNQKFQCEDHIIQWIY